jgi:hypothetical protein
MLSSSAVDAVLGIQTENRGETNRRWDLGVRPLPASNCWPSRPTSPELHGLNWPVGTSEPLRQTEFREERGVEKGHHPRHPVGPQVQHM